MIYAHTQITLKLILKWFLFLIFLNIPLSIFLWSLNKDVPLIANFFCGLISGSTIVTFAALPQIFFKKVKSYFRILMIFTGCVLGDISGLLLISTLINKIPYDIFMFLFIMNLMISSIIIGFLYYWEGVSATNVKLHEERVAILDMEKEMVQTRLRLVQAPIEPNFLFNTLKQVLNLLDIDVDKAKKLQLVLIQYLRMSLYKLKKETHDIRQEMEIIRAYLDILKKHPGNELDYKIDITDNIYGCQIHPMLLHLVLEMIIDYLEVFGFKKYHLSLGGKDTLNGTRFEFMISEANNLKENNISQIFQDIREKFYKTFGDKACLELQTNMSANFIIILKLKPRSRIGDTPSQ